MSNRLKDQLPPRIEQRIQTQLALAHRLKVDTAKEPPAAPFVTVSRQYGCEAMAFAEALAERLSDLEHLAGDQWQVYSRKIIEDLAEEVRLSKQVLESLDARARTGLQEFFETLIGQSPPDIQVLRHLVDMVRALALHGRCIIVGRGGAVLTRGLPGGIHVRLVAPEHWRLNNLIMRFGWEEHKARALLREEESVRHSFFRKYLGLDANSPDHYDLILNTAALNRDEQVAAVAAVFDDRFPPRT